jgi:hypothetical protein
MKGYLNNDSATAEAFTEDGWVRSGDVGFVKGGNFYVIDRTKDLIKVRGWQVSPAEIEASLLEHPDILDAGVIGVAAKDGTGEVPEAFIVRKEGSGLEEKDVKDFLSVRLARYKGVDDVQFVEKIPRNPTGKILRRVLRDSRKATRSLTSDQIVASAYSTAIKDLDQYQRQLVAEKGCDIKIETKFDPNASMGVLSQTLTIDTSRTNGGHSRTESNASALTEASTIDSFGPATPRTPRSIDGSEEIAKSKKRKGEPLSPSKHKRRSARIGVRVRAT